MNTYIFEYNKKGHIFTNKNHTEIYANRIEQAIREFKDLCVYDKILNIYRVDDSYSEYVNELNEEKIGDR